jgi:NADH-quinone oxidoreductase subunit M
MLGVFALNQQGIEGGILQMVNHGLSTGALFLAVGLIYERRHTRMIKDFGGLSKQMPVYAAMFMIVTLSSIGLPGLNGFIGEFTILVGAFKALWMKSVGWMNPQISTLMVLLATSGIVLGAAYMLWMFQRVMFGKLENPENMKLKDLNLREAMTLIPIIFFCFWIGVYPKPFLKFMDAAVANTVSITNPAAAAEEAAMLEEQLARQEAIASGHAYPAAHEAEQGAPHEIEAGHGAAVAHEQLEPVAHVSVEAEPVHADAPGEQAGHSAH